MLLRNRQEYPDNSRVKLTARAALNFLTRMRHRQRFAIGPVADHGVERIGDGKYPRSKRNLVALQPARIARAVIEFLMRQHDLRGVPEKRDADQHVVPDLAVLAHDRLFIVVQGTGFPQDSIRNGHLADVVKESRARQYRQIELRHGHRLRDGNAKRRNPLAVSFGFGVFQVQRASQGLQRVIVGLFELCQRAAELCGSFLDLLLQVALIIAVFDHQPPVLQRAPYAEKQLVLFERLQDVVIRPAANRFQRRRDVVDRRDHDHRHFRIVLPHPFQQFEPIHLRHDHVAQDQVRRGPLDLLLRDSPVVHRGTVVAFRLKHRGNDLSNRFLIVHDQYVFHLHVGWPPLAIICDGTREWGRPCPVRKQHVSVAKGLSLRASHGPSQVSSHEEHRRDGISGWRRGILVENQGLLGIAFFEATAFIILLVLFFLFRRDQHAGYFRYWLVGWGLLTFSSLCEVSLLVRQLPGLNLTILASHALALLLFLVAVMQWSAGSERSIWSVLPVMVLISVGIYYFEHVGRQRFASVHWETAGLESGICLSAGWLLWRSARARRGYGAQLLAGILFLSGLHGLDRPLWLDHPLFLLRIAFDHLLGVALGIAMVVAVLEGARARTEELNDKMRRLTFLTTASTQTLSVQEVLEQVLSHLVESLGATHGMVRLKEGQGNSAQLIARAAVGFDKTYMTRYARVSAMERWAQRVLNGDCQFLRVEDELDSTARERMTAAGLKSLVALPLPG